MARQLRREDYTVGWVCALPVELAAAQQMFDEEHLDLQHDPADNDENLYALGTISGHNVAIVCLPAGRIGNNPAAAVATQMRATFKQMRFGLMVGIGGGVPSDEADIRLGDVVVSQPHGIFAGVVQYDSGKTTLSGFERTGALNSPPQMLLAAVARVRANEMLGRSKLCEHIAKLEDIGNKFRRSKAGPDVLFEAAYKHEGGQTCDRCSLNKQEARQAREEEVIVHYGTIASGNRVIKDAVVRDKLSSELGGVLCFEMEAAGLMNSFPCLTIRGICDYADSHKNKQWQPYAAGTAAAYAKEVLSAIPPAEVAKSRTAEETMRDRIVKPTYYIPFLKNRHFTGRRDELAVLRQRLLVDQDCQKMSIVGLGGMGKTQVALQFAYLVKETLPECSIFWLPAVSMESFEQACAGIAEALDIPKAVIREEDPKELVKQQLSSSRAGKWLLIVDNANNTDIFFGTGQRKGIADYLPESESGVVLYTTRTPEMAELTPGDVIQLGEMGRQDATDFLTKSLIRQGLQDGPMTIKLVNELLDELTCLPLAIAQAAAYLNRNRMPISKYLRLLRNTEQDLVSLMSSEFRDDTRYKGSANAVARTWVVSFSQIRKYDVVAADMLEFMSCVEWKAIPRSLLPSVQSEARMEEAIGTLCGYSFLARRGNDDHESKEESDATIEAVDQEWFDIHRLVHLATRIWIREYGDATGAMGGAIRHVAEVFPSDDHANREVWRAYLPHALRLLSAKVECDVEEKAELCLSVGKCLEVDGRIREAVNWLEESCRLRSMLGEDDPDLLTAQHQLAAAYQADGQIKKAVELLEAVVEVRKKVLSADHPNQLASQHVLAVAYRADGQVKRAVELLEAVVKVKDTLSADRPSRLASQHELAITYRADGRVEKAVELLEVVVKAKETLSAEHPLRLASQHELAIAYQADGQVEKAVELLEIVVKVKETLSAEHPLRLASQHELARAYHADGQVQKAVELLEAVVNIKEETLNADHPDRLASQHELARAYHADGQRKKAVELLEGVVKAKETLNAEHPGRLVSQHELARVYHADGQVQKAIELLEAVVKVREETLNADHPDQLASQHELAKAYHADGQIKKAVKLLERVVKAEETLSAEHPDRLVSQHQLAIAYHADGQTQKAVELLQIVVEIEARTLRDDDPSRLVSVEALADILAELDVDTDETSSSTPLKHSTEHDFVEHDDRPYD